jgi:predicted metal-dependent hydrolase
VKKIIADNFEIVVEKKKIKHMYLRISNENGTIKVTAPYFVKDEEIKKFVYSKLPWIRKHRRDAAGKRSIDFLTDNKVFLWGRVYPVDTIYSDKKENEVIVKDRVVLSVNKDCTEEKKEEILKEWCRKQLWDEILRRRHEYEKIVGEKAEEWKIRNMKTRWGTCNTRAKRIWINLQLIKYPPECLKYVMIHELVHLLEKSHNAVFWNYVNEFFPEWREAENKLSQQ